MTKVFFPKLGLEFSINRVAFRIPFLDLEVYWYGLLIAIGAVIAFVYVYKRSDIFGVDKDQLSDLVIAGIISGVLGARIYYVVFSSPGEISGFAEIFNLRQGGLAFYGGVIGGVLSTFIYCKIKKVRFLPVLDIASYGFLIGQAIGRWGNFVNQEAFGVNTDLPWGMTSSVVVNYLNSNFAELRELGMIVDPMKPVHPTFLYESVWCFIGFIFLHFMAKHRRFDGEMFLYYIGINGLGRFFIEGLRTDSLYFLGMRVSQLLAILGFIASSIALIYIRTRIKTSDDPDYLKLYVNTEQYLIDRERLELKRNKRKADEVEGVELSDIKEEISNLDSAGVEEIKASKSDVTEGVAEKEIVPEVVPEDDFAVGTETEKDKDKEPRAYEVIKISAFKTEKQETETEGVSGYYSVDSEIKMKVDPGYSKKLYTKIEIDGASVYSKIAEKNKPKSNRNKASGKTKARYSQNYNKKYKNKGSGKKVQNENKE